MLSRVVIMPAKTMMLGNLRLPRLRKRCLRCGINQQTILFRIETLFVQLVESIANFARAKTRNFGPTKNGNSGWMVHGMHHQSRTIHSSLCFF